MSVSPAANKQLERTVTRRHVRAASATFHYAHAARWTARRAAAQLRRHTAQMALRVAGPCLLILLAGLVSSCSEVFLVELFNNTGSPVAITVGTSDGEQETIDVAAGRSTKVWEGSLHGAAVSIEGSERSFEFDVPRFLLPREYTSARPPSFPGRRVRFQLNADGTVWATKPRASLPISASEEQPEGFPVVLQAT